MTKYLTDSLALARAIMVALLITNAHVISFFLFPLPRVLNPFIICITVYKIIHIYVLVHRQTVNSEG